MKEKLLVLLLASLHGSASLAEDCQLTPSFTDSRPVCDEVTPTMSGGSQMSERSGAAMISGGDPYSYENSEYSYENSSVNYRNSPGAYENRPMGLDNERVLRDNKGHPIGYAVPKSDGGVNYFDYSGKRIGYQQGRVR